MGGDGGGTGAMCVRPVDFSSTLLEKLFPRLAAVFVEPTSRVIHFHELCKAGAPDPRKTERRLRPY